MELQLMLEGSAKSRHAASLWPEFSANSARYTNLANWDEKPTENQEFQHLDLFRNFSLFDIFRHFSTFKFWPFGDILDMSSLPGSLCWNQLESWLPSRCATAEVRTHWKQPSETGSDAPWSSKERHRKTVWKTAKNCIQSLKRMFTQSIAVKSDEHVRQKKHLGSGTKSPKLPEYLWNNYQIARFPEFSNSRQFLNSPNAKIRPNS